MLKCTFMTLYVFFMLAVSAVAGQEVISVYTTTPPVLDGIGDDVAWKSSPTVVTQDAVASIPIELQSIYTDTSIFMKVRFPDSTENRVHKLMNWDESTKTYRTGTLREDSIVLKWNMEPLPVDVSLQSETEYRADIWFWKSFRTDPLGYADDKMHIYSFSKRNKAQDVILANGKIMYLSRPSDSGKSSYQSIAYEKFMGDSVPRYRHRQPTGSRADIKAKGAWKEGFWTIEFQRDLMTNNDDDIQFQTNIPSYFGVSRYEIAGKRPNPKLEQPNYESGDISEVVLLKFKK